jgi:hypothetical protein
MPGSPSVTVVTLRWRPATVLVAPLTASIDDLWLSTSRRIDTTGNSG